jgi:hypothetical protein
MDRVDSGRHIYGIQFIRSELTNPPVTADLQAPVEVKQILLARTRILDG